jgi:hypothetical protein
MLVQTKNAARRGESAKSTGKMADQVLAGRHAGRSTSATKESADTQNQGHEPLMTVSA